MSVCVRLLFFKISMILLLLSVRSLQQLRRELAGVDNRNLEHIMSQCDVSLELRGNAHGSLSQGRLPLHFLIRAKESQFIDNSLKLIRDLVTITTNGMARKQQQQQQQQQQQPPGGGSHHHNQQASHHHLQQLGGKGGRI